MKAPKPWMFLVAMLSIVSTVMAQPVKLWEQKLVDYDDNKNLEVAAYGLDGSALLLEVFGDGTFWVTGDGTITSLENSPYSGGCDTCFQVLYINAQDLLIRITDPRWLSNPSNWVRDELIQYSKSSTGTVTSNILNLGGDLIGFPTANSFVGPLAVFTTRVTDGVTYVSKWSLPISGSPATVALKVEQQSRQSLAISAESTSTNRFSVESSKDLNQWTTVTNGMGQVNIVVPTSEFKQFFRGGNPK